MVNTTKAPMWDKMQFFCKRIADHQIRFVLRFNALLNEKTLKDAIKITAENNPVISAKYVENKMVYWEYEAINIDNIYTFFNVDEPQPFIQKAIVEKLDTLHGKQMKIYLIRSKTDTLICNCDHTITDAAGLKHFMYELADNYSHIAQNKTIKKKRYTPSRSLKLLSKNLSLKEKASIIKVMLTSKKNAPTFCTNMKIDDIHVPDFKILTLDPNEFDKIKKYGKKYKATINDMLLAIFFHALKEMVNNKNKTNRLTYSSDLRTYMQNEKYDTLSNYSAIHNIDINNTTKTFEDLVKQIASITKVRKQLKYDMADFPVMAMLFKSFSYNKMKSIFYKEFDKIKSGKSQAAQGITNMGIIDEEKIKFYNIYPDKAYMLGTINHPGVLIVSASSYNKNLTLSVGSLHGGQNNEIITKILDRIKSVIHKVIV